MEKEEEIDDSFYSRQRYVLGDTAMLKLNRSRVLIVGLSGIGLEIAKNIILSGVQHVVIKDNKMPTIYDLGYNFYLKPSDVNCGKTRAEICLPKLKELNSHVKVELDNEDEFNDDKLVFFNCVVLTECSLSFIQRVDSFCYQSNPPIKVIVADVYGVFGGVFCDFGPKFEIVDKSGEDPVEFFIADVTNESAGVVTLQDDNNIGSLTDGDTVIFREVQGMTQLNGSCHKIKIKSPYSFEIGDTSSFDEYVGGGICTQVILPTSEFHVNLGTALFSFKHLLFTDIQPELDVSAHVAFLALHEMMDISEAKKKYLAADSKSHNLDVNQFLDVCNQMYQRIQPKNDFQLNNDFLKIVAHTWYGTLTALCSVLGGFAAQEVLKAVTCKFTPLNQMMYISVPEVYGKSETFGHHKMKSDRYDCLRVCIGDDACKALNDLKLFLVGCGAIGCELLKIFALSGVACDSSNGEIVVTDNDIIEKSNLNRQFLFKDRHVRMPKSDVGADSVREINAGVNIKSFQNKVCPESEDVFTDEFFENRDIVVNALDNVEARLYVDERCVSAEKPLLDSGTMGTKGSVQTVLPHVTENYGHSRDPESSAVLMCTLKSFPATINHTIIWARNKFESLFVEKPSKFNSFWHENGSPEHVYKIAESNILLPDMITVLKFYSTKPKSLADCVQLARLKFEKYFNHRAKQLLCVFPLDHRLNDGSLFWQLPKRPPKPIEFDFPANQLHSDFIISSSKLFASVHNIPFECDQLNETFVEQVLSDFEVPKFIPKNKKIATDDEQLETQMSVEDSGDVGQCLNVLETIISDSDSNSSSHSLNSISFEKDDDLHIDFVTATSNLRAIMYGLQPADRYTTKKTAGKIIPAISTTTACVSGLVALELIKMAIKIDDVSKYRNCYLNLAFPLILFAQPMSVEKIKTGNESFTIWDKFKITGNDDFKLSDLITKVEDKYNGVVTMVAEGKKAFYLPPVIINKTKMKMNELSQFSNSKKCTDLVVSMESADGEDSLECPTVRYYFK